jgi:hypothetical protein
MGHGSYSHEAHEALLRGRASVPVQEVFRQRECHPLMNPKGVKVRECRDSADHPRSIGIVFALDVTGSMSSIPRMLATEQLPRFMKILTECKVPDPQILFVAVGDATSDRASLQVGQFESTAELMDQWLTWSYLEGGGGGTFQESYELALYFLAQHTAMDCWEKRRRKGYLFMTGDEHPYPVVSKHTVEAVIGDRLDDDLKVEEAVAELQKTMVPFFLIPDEKRAQKCGRRWRDILGDHVLVMSAPADACYVAAGAILLSEGLVSGVDAAMAVLRTAGVDDAQAGGVAKALKPLAETLSLGGGGGAGTRGAGTGGAEGSSAGGGLRKLLGGLFKG